MKNYLKRNKALFVLPLALIPFVVLIFYVLGGGENAEMEKQKMEKQKSLEGANYILPEADKSIEIVDKLEAYQQQGITPSTDDFNISVKKDSLKHTEASLFPKTDSINNDLSLLARANKGIPENLLAHIKQKESEINKELNKQVDGDKQKKPITGKAKVNKKRSVTKTQNSKPQSQPQAFVNTTGIEELDKVFDENINLTRQNDSLKFYLNRTQNQLIEIEQKQNASFSLNKKQDAGFNEQEEMSNLIKAEIYETTTVLDGNRVKLRLLENTWVNEKKISKNTFIYGICKIKNERLQIQITQLPVGNNFLPVNLTIYDLDGLPGLYVPDNVARKVTQEVGSSTNTSSMLGVTNNPITYAGIRAADKTAQTLLKRVRLKKVTVKKNTLVYLINQQPMAGMK